MERTNSYELLKNMLLKQDSQSLQGFKHKHTLHNIIRTTRRASEYLDIGFQEAT